MSCMHLRQAYPTSKLTKNGKQKFSFSHKNYDFFSGKKIYQVPCKQCLFCRIKLAREWTIRALHENMFHEKSTFITLTYDGDNLPTLAGIPILKHKDFQDFMRDLRKCFNVNGIKYLMCGEYGDRFSRPHYHLILFGIDFEDKTSINKNIFGHKHYKSEQLNRLWKKGNCIIGDVSYMSINYVARYVMKKVNGPQSKKHYLFTDVKTGKEYQRPKEYATHSKRPGLGHKFFDKYYKNIYDNDFIVYKKRKVSVPAYYDRLLKEQDEDMYQVVKARRYEKSQSEDVIKKQIENIRRWTDIEEHLRLKMKKQIRRYESQISNRII